MIRLKRSSIRKIDGVFLSTFIILLSIIYVCTTFDALSLQGSESGAASDKAVINGGAEPDKADCTAPAVQISQGRLCGKRVKTSSGKWANAYLGIPYAESAARENRWRPPVPDKGWDGLYTATAIGPACPQKNKFFPGLAYSEDCLSLNVWTPETKSDEPRAVMVFVYGGYFLYGFTGDPGYDGAYNAANGDVVLVSINYRLGALGFLAGTVDKETGEKINGNFGLLDQIQALKWVRENIGAFGGDPKKVTIQGQSAGAMSVGIHLTASPASVDLFRAAIMESNPLAMQYKTLKQAEPLARKFAEKLGCSSGDASCMRKKTTDEILAAQDLSDLFLSTLFHGISGSLVWSPVIDGEVFMDQPIAVISKGKLTKPLIAGTNKEDALLFIIESKEILNLKKVSDVDYHVMVDFLFRDHKVRKKIYEKYPPQGHDNTMMASKLMTDWLFTCPSLHTASNSSPKTWVYLFDDVPSFNIWERFGSDFFACSQAVCHAVELEFVFHTAENLGHSFTEEERLLSRVMIGYWTNFARNLNPNGKGPQWPEFKSRSSNVILVTPVDKIESQADLKAHCKFWDSVGYDLHYSLWDLL